MSYKTDHTAGNGGSVSVMGFGASTLGLFKPGLSKSKDSAIKKQAAIDQVYSLDSLILDDELHLFCENSYIVLRKTANSYNLEYRSSSDGAVDTEVRYLGFSLAPNDFYKKDNPSVFIGGWLHLAECLTFRPDRLGEIPMDRIDLIGENFVLPEDLPLAKLEQNIRNGNIIVGRDKKPYYQLLIPARKELVFGPITDIILM